MSITRRTCSSAVGVARVWTGKTNENQHRRIKLEEEEKNAKTPVLELDYFFLKGHEYMITHGHPNPAEEVTCLNLICKKSGSGGCTKVQQKGKDEYAIEFVHQQVKQMGWTTIVCKCDPENSTHLIVEELAKKRAHPTIEKLRKAARGR